MRIIGSVKQAIDLKDAVPVSLGASGMSAPIWLDWLGLFWQYGISALGAAVLILTAISKVQDIKLKRRELENE